MAEPNTDIIPEPKVTYYPESGILYVETGAPFGDGETIAKNVVVFYDREDESKVVGVCIGRGADVILKPFVDAILAERGVSLADAPTGD